MNNIIDWLQNWTMSQIDGDWEHELGVSIRMLDNPGWLLSADISNYFNFGLNTAPMKGKTDNDWIDCYIIAKQSSAYLYIDGGLKKLNHLLHIFRAIIQELEKMREEKGILTANRIKEIMDSISKSLENINSTATA